MGKPKGKSKKALTLAELEEHEDECRLFMEYREEYHDLPDLPAVDANQDEIDGAVFDLEQVIQEAKNLVHDGEEWIKAFRALIEARAKVKQKEAA